MARLSRALASLALGAALLAAACGGPSSAASEFCRPASQAHCQPRLTIAPGRPLLKVVTSRYGPILVTNEGFTVYRFTADNAQRSECSGPCRDRWPPLLVPDGDALAPVGGLAPADLSTFPRPDGGRQLAYRLIPLYVYSGDVDRGSAYGEDVRDVAAWYVVRTADSSPSDPGPAVTLPVIPSPAPRSSPSVAPMPGPSVRPTPTPT